MKSERIVMKIAKKISVFSLMYFVLIAACITSCRYPSTPIRYQSLDSVLTSGRLEYYGAYYEAEGIDYDVVSLDLYSEGLGLNKEGKMEGVGTNLYVSDIFVPKAEFVRGKPQSVLPAGSYQSDSTANLMHFLRGLDYDDNYGGSYVLLMGESGYSVSIMTVGEMTVAYAGDTLILDGIATLDKQQKPYPFHYRGKLPMINRER